MDNSSVGSVGGGGFDSGGAMQSGDIQMETSFENVPEVSEVEVPEEVKTENSSIAQVQIDDAKEIMDIQGTAHEKLAGLSEMTDEKIEDEDSIFNEKDNSLEDAEQDAEQEPTLKEKVEQLKLKALEKIVEAKNEEVSSGEIDMLLFEIRGVVSQLSKENIDPKTFLFLIKSIEGLKEEKMSKKEILILAILFIIESILSLGEKGIAEIDGNQNK